MINGAHAIIYSTDAEADRTFLRDILGLPHVDVGGGWLIFGLPPSEVAVHPSVGESGGDGGTHELYFMCSDVEALKAQLSEHDVESSPVEDQGWGLVTQVTLPGGSKIGIYEPRHARPEAPSSGARTGRAAKRAPARKAPAKKAPSKNVSAKRAPTKALGRKKARSR